MVGSCYIKTDQSGLNSFSKMKHEESEAAYVYVKENFYTLGEEKQKRIINAALLEFAEKGFEQASTNVIVKQAQIGKGTLFYYFNSKQELYYFLIDYCLDFIMNQYLNQLNREIGDILELFKHISRQKLEFFNEFPEVSKFLTTLVLMDGVPESLIQKYEQVVTIARTNWLNHSNVNPCLFRRDIDPKRASQLIMWMIKGYEVDSLEEFKGKKLSETDIEKLFDDFDEYLAILRTTFYKQDGESNELC
jgi:AcrR family transcriptional regulator